MIQYEPREVNLVVDALSRRLNVHDNSIIELSYFQIMEETYGGSDEHISKMWHKTQSKIDFDCP